jgi:prepilin peptidase CpaA
MTIIHWAALAIAAVACVTDLRTRRIPNALTFGGALAGLAFHSLGDGGAGPVSSAAGWLAGIAIFFPIFALGGMGAGDVKLLGAIGAWLGAPAILFVAMFTAIAGGVLGVAVALANGYLRRAVHKVGYLLWFWKTVGIKPVEGFTLEHGKGPRLAYAVPMLAGLLVTLWVR